MSLHWTINISSAERVARIGVGTLATLTGVILLAGAASGPAVLLEILLVLAGLDLVITGALGHCPLYARLGYGPASSRGRTS